MGDTIDFRERENELKPWITNGTGGYCKNFSNWTDWSEPNADIDTDTAYALPNYLLCDKDTCRHMTDGKWTTVWGNCKTAAGVGVTTGDVKGSKDKCYNMITDTEIGDGAGGVGAANYIYFECKKVLLMLL